MKCILLNPLKQKTLPPIEYFREIYLGFIEIVLAIYYG